MAFTPEQKAAWEREKLERAERLRQEQALAEMKKVEGEQKIKQVIIKADQRERKAKLVYVVSVFMLSLLVVAVVLWVQKLF